MTKKWISFGKMIKGLIKSCCQIFWQIAFGRRPDVIFYSPRLFNRSSRGTNPYFEPLVKLCQENGISYLCLEEPAHTPYPEDHKCTKADALLWLLWLEHKICINGLKWSLHRSDKFAGRFFDFITFHRLRAKTYITISNSLVDALGEMNPNGNVYDYQHGIIYYGHQGYFLNEDELRPEFKIKNRHVLLWGDLYKKNLRTLPDIADSDDKFIVVGYPMYAERNIDRGEMSKSILVSMQFTSDISSERADGMLDMLDEFLATAVAHGYKVLLKHHPRFANEVDLGSLIKKYDGEVELTAMPLDIAARHIKLHVTWGSTTAMEYASYGIPTIFLRDCRFDWATELFYGQYCYPLYDNTSYEEVLKRVDDKANYDSDCATIKQWYESAYAPLNKELLVKILKGDLNK